MLPDGRVVQLSPAGREAVLAAVDTMAGEALRILALAKRTDMPAELGGWNGDSHSSAAKKLLDTSCYSEVESGLVFLGLVGLQDPPRPEVPDAIEACSQAGIRVIVITGRDELRTAYACMQRSAWSTYLLECARNIGTHVMT
jgi:Ca2+-transporting ATPase